MSTTYTASSPSNIALIKYWGKKNQELQIPSNDSLSMTLSVARTETTAQIIHGHAHEFYFAGQPMFQSDRFATKIFQHLTRICDALNFKGKLRIDSRNTFPVACGIASSASGFSALTVASCAAIYQIDSIAGFGEADGAKLSLTKLADLARLGSGSACRSLLGGFVHWSYESRDNTHRYQKISEQKEWILCDLIVLVSTQVKSVSSSNGHTSAMTSPFQAVRTSGVNEKIRAVKDAVSRQDIELLGFIAEADAMEMLAVMAASKPSLVYATEQTGHVIAWLREKRFESGKFAFFTLDAGPNPHVICEQSEANFWIAEIAKNFPNFELLVDKTGEGTQVYSTHANSK